MLTGYLRLVPPYVPAVVLTGLFLTALVKDLLLMSVNQWSWLSSPICYSGGV